MSVILSLALFAALPQPGRHVPPERFRVDAMVAGGTQRIADKSYRAFDPNWNAPAPTIALRADGRIGLTPIFLGAGLGYRRFATEHTILDGIGTHLLIQDVLITARLSVSLYEGIDLFASAQGGPSIVDVRLNASFVAEQRKMLAMFGGLGGVALSLPRRWIRSNHVTGGLDVGVGYVFRNEFDVRPAPQTGDATIGTTATTFGDVRLHGVVWRAGVFVRFL